MSVRNYRHSRRFNHGPDTHSFGRETTKVIQREPDLNSLQVEAHIRKGVITKFETRGRQFQSKVRNIFE